MNLAEIKNSDWSISLTAAGAVVEGVESIKQRIDTIVKTPKYSVPLNNGFGCDIFKFMDKPSNFIAEMKAEILDSLETWETKAIVTKINITFEIGKVNIEIKFSVIGNETPQSTIVIL